jgi:hypothetical protein
MTRSCHRSLFTIPLALLVACAADDAARPEGGDPIDESGDGLAALRGTIEDETSGALEDIDAMLVLRWHYENEQDADEPVYEEVAVSGELPAEFTLDIVEAPPERTWGTLDGPDDNPSEHRVARAALELYAAGTTEFDRENAISWEEWHFVQYAPGAIPAGEVEIGVDIPQGFSLIEHTEDGPVISPIETPLEIRLVDDTDDLHDPFDDV